MITKEILLQKLAENWDGEIEINLPLEQFLIYKDIRHKKDGFRVLRYLYKENEWNWDESYQFYHSLEEVAEAINSKNYIVGRANF